MTSTGYKLGCIDPITNEDECFDEPFAVLRRLLGHGVRVDVKDNDGREPLMWAASAGSTDAILTLVNAGAAVSARDKERTEI